MLISIVIPAYNSEKTIRKTIESILSQTYNIFEIIVIDDGSTDDTVKVVEKIRDDRLHIFSQKNQKQGAARNKGIRKSIGDLIMFVDSDDFLLENSLKKVAAQAYKNNEVEIIFYNIIKSYSKSNEIISFDKSLLLKVSKQKKSRILGVASPCMAAYKRSFLLKNNILFIENVFFEDISFMVETLYKSTNIEYIEEEIYQYNIVDNSTVRSKNPNLNSYVIANLDYCQRLLGNGLKEEFDFLVFKYLMFESTIRSIDSNFNPKTVKNILKTNKIYLRENSISLKNNKYVKKEKFINKLVVLLAIVNSITGLKIINNARRLINAIKR